MKKAKAYLLAVALFSATSLPMAGAGRAAEEAARPAMPRYDHILVIIAENKGYEQMMDHPELTPNLHRLAAEYGLASEFFAEVHSSEGNYVAMVGGDTFGIHDDDAFFCKPGAKNEFCEKSMQPDYVDHSIRARSLMDQLEAEHLSWKGYFEDLPGPGSLVPRWPTPTYPLEGKPFALYAAKHNGFVNFARVHDAPYPERMQHLVNFRQLDADLASGNVPAYAHIVPNQCNDMHGLGGDRATACKDEADLIRRGDAEIGTLVSQIMQSSVWTGAANTAIVVTFDENDGASRKTGVQGCCGYDPHSLANFGGGRIFSVVVTNHGPRHVVDPTPYNHYSLLRTTEEAFGIHEFLGPAADEAKGVVAMSPLFAVSRERR